MLECLNITLSFLSNLNLLGLANLLDDNNKMCMLCILESTYRSNSDTYKHTLSGEVGFRVNKVENGLHNGNCNGIA